jgi:hypothetical protein
VNLSRIRSELAKLQEFAAERARRGAQPLTVIVLPENSRGSKFEDDGPLPRVVWRNECAVCVGYDLTAGQPSAEDIARLIEGTP